ncbi:MAG: twin-arginine translocase subunit TatC [Armatimonadota bacterium]|nr:twin-arginine translocase subunit TatC [Armatimonadota bacterium]
MGGTEEKQAELVEHLGELRTRIIRSAIYTAVGMAVCWFFYYDIFDLLTAPLTGTLKDVKFQMVGLSEGFMLRMQVSLIAGAIIAAPLITMELWGFVSPALTRDEKRPLKWITPMCIFLFASGVMLAYLIIPRTVQFFVSQTPPNTDFRPFISQNLIFIVKMLFAFGVVFELPVVLMFLGKLGIVDSKMLRAYWRQAILLMAVVAAIATPSADAFTMIIMAVPLCFLYLLSIFLVKFVERKDEF